MRRALPRTQDQMAAKAEENARLETQKASLYESVTKTTLEALYNNHVKPVAELVASTSAWRAHALVTTPGAFLHRN